MTKTDMLLATQVFLPLFPSLSYSKQAKTFPLYPAAEWLHTARINEGNHFTYNSISAYFLTEKKILDKLTYFSSLQPQSPSFLASFSLS
jgi:hypothetical protein